MRSISSARAPLKSSLGSGALFGGCNLFVGWFWMDWVCRRPP
jgi:hypothetical protein